MAARLRPRLRDHGRVAWLLVLTVLAALPWALWIPLSPVLRPWMRARLRRRLGHAPGTSQEAPVPDAAAWAGKTLFLVAGEASGDRLAAPVVASLRARCPDLKIRGYAGDACAAAGAVLDRNLPRHAVVGVMAVLRSFRFWWGLCVETLARLREEPPDVFLTVDFPGLNGRLAHWARRRGITTIHLVAPAVWAYMPWRIGRWRRALDHLLTTFAFEAVLFRGSGIPSTFVGHPSFQAPLPPPRTPHTWPGDAECTIELLPGSRRQEIALHAALLTEAAARIERRIPGAHFAVRLVDAAHAPLFEERAATARDRPTRLSVHVGAHDGGPPLLGAVASSGTVTAELAAACVPMAIVYRVSPMTRFLAFVGLTAPFVGLANLIAGREVVPERLQVSGRGRAVADDFLTAAGTAERFAATRADLDALVRRRVAVRDVADRAARAALYVADASSSRRNAAPVGDPSAASSPAGGPS